MVARAHGGGVPARRTLNRDNAGICPLAVYLRAFLATRVEVQYIKLQGAAPRVRSHAQGVSRDSASLQVATPLCSGSPSSLMAPQAYTAEAGTLP